MSSYTNSSNIFDAYAKIAMEKGLISKATEEYKDNSKLRYDTKDLKTIQELLYNVRPNGKDEKSIVEQAHPESLIIAPSYDRMNGLVENVQERQNVMIGICLKQNYIGQTQHRYASTKSDLVNELLKLGFLLDNENEDSLRKIADACSEQLVKEADFFGKELAEVGGAGVGALGLAAAPLIGIGWWALPVFGAVLGVMAVVNNFGSAIDQGVVNNCKICVDKLNTVLSNPSYASISQVISQAVQNISYVQSLGEQAHNIQVPTANVSNAVSIMNSPDVHKISTLLDIYSTACQKLSSYIPNYINLLKNTDQSGDVSSSVGAIWDKVKNVFSPSDLDSLVSSLSTLQTSLNKSQSAILAQKSTITNFVNDNKEDISKVIQTEIKKQSPDKINSPNDMQAPKQQSLSDFIK